MPLIVQAGNQSHMFSGDFTVGRRGELAINDEYLSPQHAKFSVDADGWTVEDLGSTNGTWLGAWYGARIYGPHRVTKGMKIRVGHTVLTMVPT